MCEICKDCGQARMFGCKMYAREMEAKSHYFSIQTQY